MRHKNFNVLGILFLFGIVFFSMSFVSAALAMVNNAPAASSNVTGTYTFNVSLTGGVGGNTTFYIFNGTAGGLVQLCANVTQNVTMYTCSFNTANTTMPDGVYVINATTLINNGTGVNANLTVLIENSAPTSTLIWYTNDTKSSNNNFTLNVSIAESNAFLGNLTSKSACLIDVNGTNRTLGITVSNETRATCNSTNVSLKNLIDGRYTIKVYVNNSVGIFSQLASPPAIFVDSNGPTVELTATDIQKNSVAFAVTATDGTGTGVSSCTVDRADATVSTTTLTESGLSCGERYTYVVTCTDGNSHSSSAEESVTTVGCNSGGGSSSGGGVSASKPVTSTVSEIKPGAATVTKFTDAATGLKQIEITVNNPAQNVQITVTKYDSKPAAVSVSKTGTVQYVQISTQNLANKMTGAKVQFQVEKSKISNKDNVVISKFDETAKKWNDLATDYASEDSKFYYYDVEVSSFSYFAISETALVAGNDAGTNGASGTTGGLMWLWIVLAVVVIALVVWAVMRKK